MALFPDLVKFSQTATWNLFEFLTYRWFNHFISRFLLYFRFSMLFSTKHDSANVLPNSFYIWIKNYLIRLSSIRNLLTSDEHLDVKVLKVWIFHNFSFSVKFFVVPWNLDIFLWKEELFYALNIVIVSYIVFTGLYQKFQCIIIYYNNLYCNNLNNNLKNAPNWKRN